VALVVGDVVGRGIGAAATMGQLRSASRAPAAGRPDPGALIDALEGYARRHAVGRLATLVYAELELPTGRLRFTCAGHPPPVLMCPGEPARLLWEGRSTPLDARPATPPRGVAALHGPRRRRGPALHRRPLRAAHAPARRGAGPAPGRGRRAARRPGRGAGGGPGPRDAPGRERGRRLRPGRPPAGGVAGRPPAGAGRGRCGAPGSGGVTGLRPGAMPHLLAAGCGHREPPGANGHRSHGQPAAPCNRLRERGRTTTTGRPSRR
jgi:hypothetical protein